MQESWAQFLGREDPLEKEMATHSSILAWKIPWTEESGRLQSMGSEESDMTWQLNHHQYCTEGLYPIFYILYSFICPVHLSCFCVLVIVPSAAMIFGAGVLLSFGFLWICA